MVLNSMINTLNILQSHGNFVSYIIIYCLMFIEGPIVTYIASFASALGYFNIWIILILAILGNLVPEIIVYKIGGLLRRKNTAEKFVSYFGLHKKRIKWLEKNLKKHFIKTLFVIKAVPPLPTPGILLCGFLKVPFKKFILADIVFDIIYTVIFVSLGYYSGIAVSEFLNYFKLTECLLITALILIVLFYFLIKAVYSKIASKIKE